MQFFAPDAARRAGRRLQPGVLALISALIAAVLLPGVSLAAPLGTSPAAMWADPDAGYWIELILVAVVAAVAGIVFNVRHKHDP